MKYITDSIQKADVFRKSTEFAHQIGAVNLSQGLPEPLLGANLNNAVIKSLNMGWQYTNPWGLDDLRESVANRIYNSQYVMDEILITSGCTESLVIALHHAQSQFGKNAAIY